jgi:hypothetical protein
LTTGSGNLSPGEDHSSATQAMISDSARNPTNPVGERADLLINPGPQAQLTAASRARRSLRRIQAAERESARGQGEQQAQRGRRRELFRTGSAAGQSRARTRPLSPLVLAALLVGAVRATVALAPSRSDAVGALAATVETWIILGRGGLAHFASAVTTNAGSPAAPVVTH